MLGQFELFTQEGEALAARLVQAICQDVRDDRLTRKQAVEQLVGAIDRVSGVDEAATDPDPMRCFAAAASRAFEDAGFKPIAAEELRDRFEAWRKRGAPVPVVAPHEVERIAEAASAFAAAAAPLFATKGLDVAIAGVEPWLAAFQADPANQSDIVFFAWNGECSGVRQLGGLVMGAENSAYVEDLAVQPDVAGILRKQLLKRGGIDYRALADKLVLAAAAMVETNFLANRLGDGERLSFTLERDGDGLLRVQALWDGEPVAPAAPAAPLPAYAPGAEDEIFDEVAVDAPVPAPAPPMPMSMSMPI